MAIDKNLKELASAIMKANDEDHDTWLNEQYQSKINENTKLLSECLNLKFKENKN